MISAGFFGVYKELGPAFETATGHKLITRAVPRSAIHRKQFQHDWFRGEEAHLVIVTAGTSYFVCVRTGRSFRPLSS